VVAARQGNLLATAFHPELTPDTSLHAYFIEQCAARTAADAAPAVPAGFTPSSGA
jgi:5'-phosphate synthase pdxT subunit